MIEIVKFRPYNKNTLRGFFTCKLTNIGLEIRDCSLHTKNGKRWVSLPTKPFKKEDGSQGWSYVVAFYDKNKWGQFQKAVLGALDKYNDNNK